MQICIYKVKKLLIDSFCLIISKILTVVSSSFFFSSVIRTLGRIQSGGTGTTSTNIPRGQGASQLFKKYFQWSKLIFCKMSLTS